MMGKKQVPGIVVPVHLKDDTEVGEARVVSNNRGRPITIVLGPDEGAIIGKFLHNADLTGIGIAGPSTSSSEPDEKEADAGT